MVLLASPKVRTGPDRAFDGRTPITDINEGRIRYAL
jgi:hypothetical protein